MQCPKCQESVSSRWRFCPRCGGTVSLARIHERRHISVVFVDLVASTKLARSLESDAYFDLMGEILTVLAGEIEAHGGEVLQFQGDAVLAAFGATDTETNEQESHALRALRAAQASLKAIEAFGRRSGLNLCGRAGVDTDLATTGWVSGEFTVFGNVVNHSRRLCSAAEPGSVFVSGNTRAETEMLAQFEELALHIRDYADEGFPHRLQTIVLGEAPGFVGREQELVALGEMLEAVQETRAPLRLEIVGAPGIGKTSLIEKFVSLAERKGTRIVRLEDKNNKPDNHTSTMSALDEGFSLGQEFSAPGFIAPERWAKQMAALFSQRPGLILEPKQPEPKLAACLAALQNETVPILSLREAGMGSGSTQQLLLGPLDQASSYALARHNTEAQKQAQGNPWLLKLFSRTDTDSNILQRALEERLQHLNAFSHEILCLIALLPEGLDVVQLQRFTGRDADSGLQQLLKDGWLEQHQHHYRLRFSLGGLAGPIAQRLPETTQRWVASQLEPLVLPVPLTKPTIVPALGKTTASLN